MSKVFRGPKALATQVCHRGLVGRIVESVKCLGMMKYGGRVSRYHVALGQCTLCDVMTFTAFLVMTFERMG